MNLRRPILLASLLFPTLAAFGAPATPPVPAPAQPAPAAAEALPAGAQIVSLEASPSKIDLKRSTDYAQIVVMAKLSNGETADVTRIAERTGTPAFVEVSANGMVKPKADGQGEIVLKAGDKTAVIPVTVANTAAALKVDYVRDCMPVISKAGCNAGTCHGSKEGKAGFKLSLRGYDPVFDIRAWTDDAKGRRTNVASPDDSLMLLKSTGAVPHEGGQVITPESDTYRILRSWIADGLALDLKTPRVTKIELFPKEPVMQALETKQQIRVTATYADGLVRDVTAQAFIESGNADVLTGDKAGLMTAVRRGEAPILARFEGNYASTVVTVMGDRTGFVWQEPPVNNEIDKYIAAKLKRMKTLQSPLCTDMEFVRRVYLDLTGLPPLPEEIRAFVNDPRDSRWKRDELIDKLIGNDEWVEHWSNKWADLLQVNSKFLGGEGAKLFREWIRKEVKANTPYDQFARKILTATGSNKDNPPASYYKILREPAELMENTTHLFLATRFNCNKCHDHPFERWTQDQYYQMTAYFARTGLERDPASGDKNIGGTAVEGAKPLYEKVVDKGDGETKHDRTGAVTPPEFPYAAKVAQPTKGTRREELAAWITSADNQYFAKSFVNRIWGYLTGTGIIEPLDDIRAGNPPTNPELLEWLTKEFIQSGFDPRHVMRVVCKSRAYQLTIVANQWNEDDALNYSHAKARRLPAETLYDAIYRVTGSTSNIPGVPAGTRAAALSDSQTNLSDGFLTNLGRPVRESACECERSGELQLGPIMALVSGPTVGDAISQSNNAIAKMATEIKDDRSLVNEMFFRFLGRPARDQEVTPSLEILNEMDAHHAELAGTLQKYEAEMTPKWQERERQRQTEIAGAKAGFEQHQTAIAPKVAEAEKQRQDRIAAAKNAVAEYDKTLLPRQQEWEKQQQNQTGWAMLDPRDLKSTVAKSVLTKEKDLSIFQSGAEGKQNFTILADTQLPLLTGVRLEALADARIPANGPGRSGGGNFVLSELEVEWTPLVDESWKLAREFKFDAAGDVEGWQQETAAQVAAEGGALKVTTAPNSRKSRISGGVAAPKGDYVVEFRIKPKGDLKQKLYWTTQKDPAAADIRSVAPRETRRDGALEVVQFVFVADSDLLGVRLQSDVANTTFEIDSIRVFAGKPAAPRKIAFKDARATYSQDGYNVKSAVDGQDKGEPNGWAIHPGGVGVTQVALFIPDKPVALPKDGASLKFTMKYNYPDGKHFIGKFRLSATNAPGELNFGLPQNVIEALAVAGDQRTDAQRKIIADYYRGADAAVKKLESAVAEASKPLPEDPKLAELRQVLQRKEQPLPPDARFEQLKRDVGLSQQQLGNKRLIGAQDLGWALINNPSFLFNR